MSRAAHDPSASVETLLGQAADEFTQRVARGEHPDIDEFADQYPQIASVLRQVLPALGALGASPEPPPDDEPRLGLLGDYRLVREIGRGGMGVVYEAEQISLSRRVALKVLPFAAVLDERQLERFRREAHAAAQLHHSNIVPVFSVGCERGVHYYAMQYIEGGPLSALIDELSEHARRTSPMALTLGSSSSFSQALSAAGVTNISSFYVAVARLGIQAADALHHAHQRGVIHRDIKPANLLLDVGGCVWLTDFGLAHVRTDPGLTLTGDLLGTLRYMSPEQALGGRQPIDTRTDIYSLGMTLYELLCLRPAFDGQSRAELLRQISADEPRALRHVRDDIPKELDTIVHKAIRKEAPERYAGANELAEDLRRFLEHRPILAKPPTLTDRTAKWARRHRTLVMAGALTLCLAVIGLATSTLMISAERREAIRQRNEAREQRALADTNLQVAREAVHQLLTRGNPDALEGQELIRGALLENINRGERGKFHTKSTTTSVRLEVARAYARIGHINTLLGRDDRAEAAYRKSVEVYAELAAEDDASEVVRRELADGNAYLATHLWTRGRRAEAAKLAQTAWAGMSGDADPVAKDADQGEARARLASIVGVILRDGGDRAHAEAAFRHAADLQRALSQASPGVPRHRQELARVLTNLAGVLASDGRRDEAERVVHEVLTLQNALVSDFPDEMGYGADLAHTQRWWADVRQGGPADPTESPTAEPVELRNVASSVAGEIPWYNECLARSYRDLDLSLYRIGRMDEAQTVADQAYELQEELIQKFPGEPKYRLELALLLIQQGDICTVAWRIADAERAYLRAAGVLEQLILDHPDDDACVRRLTAVRKALTDLRAGHYAQDLVASGRQSAAGVAAAVQRAMSADLDGATISPFARLIHSEYVLLGGDYERSARGIQRIIDENPDAADYYYKSLGCALLGCGQRDAAHEAFQRALGPYRKYKTLPTSACPDYWTAAYFLDMVTAEEYAGHHAKILWLGRAMAPFPWFYIGLRAELEGRTEDAANAYRQCAQYQYLPNAHHTVHWAAYRLEQLLKRQRSAGDQSAVPEQEIHP